MTLMTCEDCKKEISTLAVSCPNCGRPNANAGIVTIEKSEKKWKRRDIFALFLVFFGMADIYLLLFTESASQARVVAALTVIALGFVIGISSLVGRWYHHG
jgi:predicted amidophosphoribosyltransferase